MTNIAFIPARGGSKGIPKKNLQEISGVSLVERAIMSAKVAHIDAIIVSTDDTHIKDLAEASGAIVTGLRSAELSADDAKTYDVTVDGIKKFEKFAQTTVKSAILLEPTSPFRTAEHVARALAHFKTGQFKSVVSVTDLERKPENIFVKNNTLQKYIVEPEESFDQRQQMAHLCRLNSAIYCFDKNALLSSGNFLIPPIGWISMSTVDSINIDTPMDLALARVLAKDISNK